MCEKENIVNQHVMQEWMAEAVNVPTDLKESLGVKMIPWCSHAAVAAELGAKAAKARA